MSAHELNQNITMLEGATHLGKCWAALREHNVIMHISMNVPNDVDFEAFRKHAIAALSLLGDVRTGDLYEKDHERYFMPRPHKHQNRSKKTPKVDISPIKL